MNFYILIKYANIKNSIVISKKYNIWLQILYLYFVYYYCYILKYYFNLRTSSGFVHFKFSIWWIDDRDQWRSITRTEGTSPPIHLQKLLTSFFYCYKIPRIVLRHCNEDNTEKIHTIDFIHPACNDIKIK